MEIFVGIDPSLNSTGLCLQFYEDNKMVKDIFYIIKPNKLTKREQVAQDTHYIYEKAICKTVAQKQAEEIEQENAKKAAKAKNTDSEIVNLLNFKKKHAYA